MSNPALASTKPITNNQALIQWVNEMAALCHDLTTARRMELGALHGSVVRRADRLGLPVPANRAVLAVLAPWARRNGY